MRRGRRSAGEHAAEVSVLRWPTGRSAGGVFEMFSAQETGWFGTASIDPAHGENVLLVGASRRDDPDAPAVLLSLVNTSPSDAVRLSVKLGGPTPRSVGGTILTLPLLRRVHGDSPAHGVEPAPFAGATLTGRVVAITVPARSVVVVTVSQ
jgi:alpha-L-arabinofuranosidase